MERKSLKDLTLLDRFLFAEAVEDPETMQILLEIILGEEIVIENLPQTEKEQRKSPRYRHIRLDVWAKDENDRIYDTEVQRRDTGNLPKRSRYYQGLIDGKLLEPGTVDFNLLNDVFIILITPFDLFGSERYRYTFRMRCEEEGEISLGDGAVRIFLNTHGKDPEHISPELAELLYFMEHTNDRERKPESEKIQRLREKVEALKDDEEVGVRYMQEWEERELEKIDARNAGREEGLERGRREGMERGLLEGEQNKLRKLVQKKVEKNYSTEKIAEDLEESVETIQKIMKEI